MKNQLPSIAISLTAMALLLAAALPVAAQTYETSLTTSTYSENFDELSPQCAGAGIPAGWVMAQGGAGPQYGKAIDTATTNWSAIAPVNYTNYTIVNEGGASGCTHDLSPGGTTGGRIIFGDEPSGYVNHSLGFRSSNPSWESPTNHFMFGFYNNTGSNILSLAVTNNIKLYGYNETPAKVSFFYSLDGTNWTAVSAGNAGPFPNTASSGNVFFFTSGPLVSNKSFTISGLNISNGSPFYLDWQFVISSANGSFSASIGLDDVGLTAALGTPPPPAGNSIWPSGAGSWATAGEWQGGVLPVSGNNLVFDGAGGAMNNNLAAVSTGTGTVGFMTFSNTASGAYSLTGNGLALTQGLTNSSSYTQTLGVLLGLTQDEYFTAVNGDLLLSGGITNGGNQVIFAGPTNIAVTGLVSGAGNVIMDGTGQLSLAVANSYGGQTILNSGTTVLSNSSAIPATSALSVNTSATLNLNGNSPSVPSLSGAGAVALGTGTLTLTGGGGGYSGAMSGAGGFIMAGTGLQSITGSNNTYQGGTTLTSGVLQLSSTATLGTGPLDFNGGTLQLASTRDTTNGVLSNEFVLTASSIINNTASAAAGTRNLPFGGAVSTTAGTLSIQNISTANSNIMNVRFAAGGINFSQPIYFDDSLAGNVNNNQSQLDCYSSASASPQIFSGTISGDGLVRRGFNIAGAGGTTIFTGNNTYAPQASSLNPYGTLLAQGIIGFGSSTTTDGGGNVLTGPIGTSSMQIDQDPYVGFFAYGGAQVVANNIIFNGVSNTFILGNNNLTLAGALNLGIATPKMFTVSNTASTIISGVITNSAPLVMAGPGTLIFSGDNNYGTTTITGGTLEVDTSDGGSGVGTNAVTVTAPGTLSGSGLIGGAVSGNGFVSPGPGPAVLTMTNGLNLSSGGTYVWELSANTTSGPGSSFDQISLTGGNLVLGGSSTLSLQFTGSATAPDPSVTFWQSSHSWQIISSSGSAADPGNTTFSVITNGASSAGYFTAVANGSGVVLNYNLGAIPAPYISPSIAGAGTPSATVTWSSVAGVDYKVQYSTNLASGMWKTLGDVTASGTSASIIDTNDAPVRFYRVVAP